MIWTYPVAAASAESRDLATHKVNTDIRPHTEDNTLADPTSTRLACQYEDGSFEKWNRPPPYTSQRSVGDTRAGKLFWKT